MPFSALPAKEPEEPDVTAFDSGVRVIIMVNKKHGHVRLSIGPPCECGSSDKVLRPSECERIIDGLRAALDTLGRLQQPDPRD